MGQSEGRLLDLWDSTGQDNRHIQLWTCVIFQEKVEMTPKMGLSPPWFQQARPGASGVGLLPQWAQKVELPSLWAWRTEHWAKEDYSWPLKSNGIFCLGFRLAYDPWPLSSFQFLLFGMGLSILCLSHYYILETDNISGFTVSQLKRNFASRSIISRVSPTLDLDDI